MTESDFQRWRKGWSAVEVILSVLILAFLAAVFFPVFITCGGHGGQRTLCLSNQKQLATATLMYLADWDERAMDRDRWMDALVPYRKHSALEHCPAVAEESNRNPNLYGYAFNSKLSLKDCSKVADPEKVELIYDSVNLARNASDPVKSIPTPPRLHKTSRRNIVAYLDGHVRALPLPKE